MQKVESVILIPCLQEYVQRNKKFISELTKEIDTYRLEGADFVKHHPTYLYDFGDRMEVDKKPGHVYAFRVPGATRGGVYTDENGRITEITFDEKTCFECIPCYDRKVETIKEKYIGAVVKQPVVRCLTGLDLGQVRALDNASMFDVANMVDEDLTDPNEGSYAYGVFLGKELIGYCTIGGADDEPPEMIERHACYTHESLLLSDVFIKDRYQGHGFGTMMVMEARKKEDPEEQHVIFLSLLLDDVAPFYQKMGWKWCDDTKEYCMVYIPPHFKKS